MVCQIENIPEYLLHGVCAMMDGRTGGMEKDEEGFMHDYDSPFLFCFTYKVAFGCSFSSLLIE